MTTTENTILITGGSSGIGLALAKRFLSLKNKVIITGRDKSKLENIKRELPEIETFQCDLTDKSSLLDLVLFIEQYHNDLNILVNNAAIQYNYSFTDEPELTDKIEYEITANLTAPVKLTGLLLPTLLKNQSSAIVNISSGLFMAPKRSAPVYCATKSAIHIFTKALRYQLENTGVKVYEIIPPLVDTPMTTGRGKSKITAKELADEFLKDFTTGRFESYIGKAKILKWLGRLTPQLADRIMKNGL